MKQWATSVRLPRSTPEQQGVPSKHIQALFNEVDQAKDACAHGLMVLRHGKVIAEGYWAPYRASIPHAVFSISKSITGMGIGMAVELGKIALDESLEDILPEAAQDGVQKAIRRITVRQLLTMTAGANMTEQDTLKHKDWLRAYLQSGVRFEPGTAFHYNSMNSYILAVIFKRRMGVGLDTYLRERLFLPMGIIIPEWQTCPMGIETGGWGLFLHLEDMAKLGQLYLQHGRWRVQGEWRQLVPEDWVAESTLQQTIEGKPEHARGYGYQLWMSETEGDFQFNGLFGQYVFVLPRLDMVIAAISGSPSLQSGGEISPIIGRRFPASLSYGDELLAEDQASYQACSLQLNSLSYHNSDELQVPMLTMQETIAQLTEALPAQYRMDEAKVAVLPRVVQTMMARPEPDVAQLGLALEEGMLVLTIGNMCIHAGLEDDEMNLIHAGGKDEMVSANVRGYAGKTGEIRLAIRICHLETGAVRTLEIMLYEDQIQLIQRETPDILLAMRKMEAMAAGTSLHENVQELPGNEMICGTRAVE